jgi:hypothetical protein
VVAVLHGYPISGGGQRSVVVAAVSQTGASCIYTFFASDVGGPIRIAMATSSDGLSWDRRGTVLEPEGEGPDGLSVHTPCVVRLHDGSVGMWYAGIPIGDEELGYRICFARFPGPWFT